MSVQRRCGIVTCNECRYCLKQEGDEVIMAKEAKQIHVVSTDALGTIGTLIDEKAGRDAIHLAVEPAIAGKDTLYPAQRVRLQDGVAVAAAPPSAAVGIVDPFLNTPVYPGQRFWLVVMPRTITSLRHVWEHPAFPSSEKLLKSDNKELGEIADDFEKELSETRAELEAVKLEPENRKTGRMNTADLGSKAASEQWMRAWAVRHVGEDYDGDGPRSEDGAYEFALEIGDNMHVGPYEDARGYIDDKWWDHWENITGRVGNRDGYFNCAC